MSSIGPYDTDVEAQPIGPSPAVHEPPADGLDLDPRAALPLALAVAVFAIAVWFVRSVPRTLTSVAIAVLIAFALNPLVESLKRRTGWQRRTAATVVLVTTAVVAAVVAALITVPTIREVRDFNDQIPKTVQDLGRLPVVGPRLREANATEKVQQWLNDAPKHLSANSKPIEHAAGAIADGVAASLFTMLLAITLLLDGEFIVNGMRRLVPARRRADADRLGRLVYDVIGRYIAGTLLVAALAGIVMLTGALSLGVPLAPLIAVWVAITNPIPQIGGFLGGLVFVLLAVTHGAVAGVIALAIFLVYQQLENHVLQPLIIGRAVHLSPPATMVAALVGVSAGGLVGGLFAIPLLGAVKAIYMSTRPVAGVGGEPAPS
jgi:predicted PurR-regulated permease PerM